MVPKCLSFFQVEVTRLFRAVGPEFLEIVKAADELRARVNGDKVRALRIFWKDLGNISV